MLDIVALMEISPADHLGAVDRSLSTMIRDGQELRLLTVTRTYDADRRGGLAGTDHAPSGSPAG